MDEKLIGSLLAIILALSKYAHAQHSVQLKPYKIVQHTQLVPYSIDNVVTVPCRSMMQAMFTCMNTSGCHGINHFSNGRCQFLTNLLTGSAATADDSVSFACKFQQFSINVVSYLPSKTTNHIIFNMIIYHEFGRSIYGDICNTFMVKKKFTLTSRWFGIILPKTDGNTSMEVISHAPYQR